MTLLNNLKSTHSPSEKEDDGDDTLDIKEIENQILSLQNKLVLLKKPKLEVIRQFTGQYFNVYEGKNYRRMESEGIPIWEYFWVLKNDWVMLEQEEAKTLEEIYQQYYR